MKSFFIAAAIASLTVALVGCGDDDSSGGDPHGALPEDCEAIIDACHEVDRGQGRIHECHVQVGESGNAQFCADNKADCLAACSGTDGG